VWYNSANNEQFALVCLCVMMTKLDMIVMVEGRGWDFCQLDQTLEHLKVDVEVERKEYDEKRLPREEELKKTFGCFCNLTSETR
jgi:hypothetical protein